MVRRPLISVFILLVAILTTEHTPALACGGDPIGSASISQSKKYKLFIKSIKVVPYSFRWDNHEVSVRECWLEHLLVRQSNKNDWNQTRDCMCFNLNVDGEAEYRRTAGENEIVLNQIDDDEHLSYVIRPKETFVQRAVYVKDLFFGSKRGFARGFVTHLMFVKKGTREVKLSVASSNALNSEITQLTFVIDDQQTH